MRGGAGMTKTSRRKNSNLAILNFVAKFCLGVVLKFWVCDVPPKVVDNLWLATALRAVLLRSHRQLDKACGLIKIDVLELFPTTGFFTTVKSTTPTKTRHHH